jgi:phenylacetate-CoA ligase
VLDRRIIVEVLDARGATVPPGAVGEITVTVGQNPLLPLVRYRTGDYGALVTLPGGAVGIDSLEGRENTVFFAADGTAVPCVDLTQHLQAHGARGWAVFQRADSAVEARIAGGDADAIAKALDALLGGAPVTVEKVATVADLGTGKPRRYRSEARRSGESGVR